jgi:glycosyltransferase involved in cell wall biosynthesis
MTVGEPVGNTVAFFLHNLDGGGAERAIVGLAGEIARLGHAVDLVVGDAESDYRAEIPPEVRVENFGTRSPFTVLLRLAAYLRRCSPAAVISALDLPNMMFALAAMLSGYEGRRVMSQRAVVEASLRELAPGRRALTRWLLRHCLRRADALISNSCAASKDLVALPGIRPDRVFTIHNALDVQRIARLSQDALDDHPILRVEEPVVVSVGSLTKRKDMETLVRAFAMVKSRRPARLIILGKGPERPNLECLVSNLGLKEHVYLPGFDPNPYRWMAAAAVFVSSSTAEGFPNVIAEALALGRPVVATDCPGDTAELLKRGEWGRLVPVGDPASMAAAILATLDDPDPPDGRLRAAEFSPTRVAAAYLDVLLPRGGRPTQEPVGS